MSPIVAISWFMVAWLLDSVNHNFAWMCALQIMHCIKNMFTQAQFT